MKFVPSAARLLRLALPGSFLTMFAQNKVDLCRRRRWHCAIRHHQTYTAFASASFNRPSYSFPAPFCLCSAGILCKRLACVIGAHLASTPYFSPLGSDFMTPSGLAYCQYQIGADPKRATLPKIPPTLYCLHELVKLQYRASQLSPKYATFLTVLIL